jgi:hypothetical protein
MNRFSVCILLYMVRRWLFAFCLYSMTYTDSAFAWIYPEHRDIAILAVSALDAEHKAIFERLWQDASLNKEHRLCQAGIDLDQGLSPNCIDWAALSAIAGDHSCSSQQMLDTVMESKWILTVADVAAQLKLKLEEIPVEVPAVQMGFGNDLVEDAQASYASEVNRAERVNALRIADTRLQRADAEYATRAAANNAHFLLARARADQTGPEYAKNTLEPGSEINAIGVYTWFHLSALMKASRLANEQVTNAQRRALSRSALFDEAFALHFLEDAFASGHVAGIWGDASQRKGTHDFYNKNGLEIFTWGGGSTSIVLMGDAHMRSEDAKVAAEAVRNSLRQVLDAASGSLDYPLSQRSSAPEAPEAFNVCKNNIIPERDVEMAAGDEYRMVFRETLLPTPVPRLGPGFGAMPRFRSELGAFIGLAGAIDGRVVNGGFDSSQNDSGWVGGLELSLRAGLGLEGALGEASDGLLFASLGFRADTASSNLFSDNSPDAGGGNLSAAIPSRSGLSLRVRMPFYVIPADLLLLSPMYFFNPEAYTGMAVTATNGGLIPLQQGIATPLGRFQFMLGRELGITFYGLDGNDQLLAPSAESGGIGRVVNFKSTSYELPILEFRPYRAFSANQSSSVMFQLFGGADVPRDASVVLPQGAPPADLETVWFLGIRMMFDGRYYFSR